MTVKYANIEVQLTEEDGNAGFILGAVRKAMKRAGVSQEEIAKFQKEATSGTYKELRKTCERWVTVL